MKNDHKPFAMLEIKNPLDDHNKNKHKLDDKCDALVHLINMGIDVYHHSAINTEINALNQQRQEMKALLKNKLNLKEMKALVDRLKKTAPRHAELAWREENAQRLANQGLINQLTQESFHERQGDIQKILHYYQMGSFYVLHKASDLANVAEDTLPILEFCTTALLKRLNKKSALFKQVLLLQKSIEEERANIAAAMLLRIEAAFYYHDFNQDDALVYVYHRLIEWGSLNHNAPLKRPERSLNTALFSKFYTYIQEHGSPNMKARLNTVVATHPSPHLAGMKTEVRRFNDKSYKIPAQLSHYIPTKKSRFSWGARLRYDFFQKHAGTLILLESYSRWEEQRHPYGNVLLLYRLRDEIRRHREEVQLIRSSIGAVQGLFLRKTKRFLSNWEHLLADEENRSWVRHYDALKRQADDYLRHPTQSGNTKEAVLSHLSLFIVEIEKFGPPLTQAFVEPLKQLKRQLNDKILETESVIDSLDSQIQLSEILINGDFVPQRSDEKKKKDKQKEEETFSISSEAIDEMEREVELLDVDNESDEASNASDSALHMSASTKARVSAWAQGLFLKRPSNRNSDSDQASLLENKH